MLAGVVLEHALPVVKFLLFFTTTLNIQVDYSLDHCQHLLLTDLYTHHYNN